MNNDGRVVEVGVMSLETSFSLRHSVLPYRLLFYFLCLDMSYLFLFLSRPFSMCIS